jgi:hypothetical protein
MEEAGNGGHRLPEGYPAIDQETDENLSTNAPFSNDLDRQLELAVGERERRLGALASTKKSTGAHS